MDEKRELLKLLLCPFRKETTYHPSCNSEYPDSFALPSSSETFLPCMEEKCMAWAGGQLRTCMIPRWKMPEV